VAAGVESEDELDGSEDEVETAHTSPGIHSDDEGSEEEIEAETEDRGDGEKMDHSYIKKAPDDNGNVVEHGYGQAPDPEGQMNRPFGGRGGLFKLDQQAVNRRNFFKAKMKKFDLFMFECRACNEVFDGEERAWKHANKKTCKEAEKVSRPLKNFACDVCSEICVGRRALVDHFARQHGAPDRCSQCDQTFTRRSTWLKHVKSHKGLNIKHACPRCDYQTESKSNLRRHLKQHIVQIGNPLLSKATQHPHTGEGGEEAGEGRAGEQEEKDRRMRTSRSYE
jgi:uncharacterized C2H2 Zn-finger protein